MAILRWTSSRERLLLHERMSKLFDETLAALASGHRARSGWMPACDIYETPTSFVMKVETPGVELTDVALEINDNEVIVTGQRKRRLRHDPSRYQRVERGEGRFVRAFTLPMTVDESGASASLKDGVLTVVMPKRQAATPPKVIEIQVG